MHNYIFLWTEGVTSSSTGPNLNPCSCIHIRYESSSIRGSRVRVRPRSYTKTGSTRPRPIRSPSSSCVHIQLLRFISKNHDLSATHGYISSRHMDVISIIETTALSFTSLTKFCPSHVFMTKDLCRIFL
jgi:hypothetical protein